MPVPDRRDLERHLLRDDAYLAMSEAIVAGTLEPGEQLHDSDLCAWLGLSRTPVRDALARLADDGLVETAPQRYTRVAALSIEEVRHLFPVLAVLHGLATELAVPRLRASEVTALRTANEAYVRALQERDAAAAARSDEAFHGVLVRAAANPEVDRALARSAPRVRRLARLCTGALPGRRSVAQHQALLERAEGGDAVGAASASRANWITLGAVLETAFTRVGQREHG